MLFDDDDDIDNYFDFVGIDLESTTTTTVFSFGRGRSAYCKMRQAEDMTYLASYLRYGGVFAVCLQFLLSSGIAFWVWYNRTKRIILTAQPTFLILISLGCFICAASIVPLTIQGDYRYVQDPTTGQLTDEVDPAIRGVDIACMANIWLFSIGFVIVFSALFAKIWRVKKLMDSGRRCERRVVDVKDVLPIMVIMLLIVIAILVSWQMVDALRWERDILQTDQDDFPIRSIGQCRTGNANSMYYFLGPLFLLMIGCLLYSLYLSYITRKQQFTEGTWITASIASIAQILLLGLPVMFIVHDDTNASFFVLSGLIFMMSITITSLIFGPKMYDLHIRKDETATTTSSSIPARKISGLNLTPEEVQRYQSYQNRSSTGSFFPSKDLSLDYSSSVPKKQEQEEPVQGNRSGIEEVPEQHPQVIVGEQQEGRRLPTPAAPDTSSAKFVDLTGTISIIENPSRENV